MVRNKGYYTKSDFCQHARSNESADQLFQMALAAFYEDAAAAGVGEEAAYYMARDWLLGVPGELAGDALYVLARRIGGDKTYPVPAEIQECQDGYMQYETDTGLPDWID